MPPTNYVAADGLSSGRLIHKCESGSGREGGSSKQGKRKVGRFSRSHIRVRHPAVDPPNPRRRHHRPPPRMPPGEEGGGKTYGIKAPKSVRGRLPPKFADRRATAASWTGVESIMRDVRVVHETFSTRIRVWCFADRRAREGAGEMERGRHFHDNRGSDRLGPPGRRRRRLAR